MSEHLTDELGKILDAYDLARREDDLRRRRLESEKLGFLAEFAQLRAAVLRPVFEAAGEMLKAHGHEFAIREEEFVFGADGKAQEALISLSITPAGLERAAPGDAPQRELSFSTRHYNRTVSIANGGLPQSGSMAGAAGGYPLAQIDAQLVEEHVLKLAAALVRA